jgi:hypothetical protein
VSQPDQAGVLAVAGQGQRVDEPDTFEREPSLLREEGNVFGQAQREWVCAAVEEACFEKRSNFWWLHGPVGEPTARGLDLDQGLEPEQPARAGAHDLDLELATFGFRDDGQRDLVGAY